MHCGDKGLIRAKSGVIVNRSDRPDIRTQIASVLVFADPAAISTVLIDRMTAKTMEPGTKGPV